MIHYENLCSSRCLSEHLLNTEGRMCEAIVSMMKMGCLKEGNRNVFDEVKGVYKLYGNLWLEAAAEKHDIAN